MKKAIITLISIIPAITLLAACGADSASPAMMSGSGGAVWNDVYDMPVADAAAPMATPIPMPEAAPMEAEMIIAGSDTAGRAGGGSDDASGVMPLSAPGAQEFAEKIIYSYYADIETLEFDKTLEDVAKMIAEYGAFIESSSVSGNTYASRGWTSLRHANYVIRVPANRLSEVTAKLDTLGNVVNQNSYAENITSQFYDSESRLKALRVQEERLLDMLSKANDVPDLITIETSLAEVRYQIERLTTTLMGWQRQVDFSTLTLSISEVEEYKIIEPAHRTYWERMGDGLVSTLKSVGEFFTDLFMWLVVSAPVLIILAAIAVLVIYLVRRQRRKIKERKAGAQWGNQSYYYGSQTPPPAPPTLTEQQQAARPVEQQAAPPAESAAPSPAPDRQDKNGTDK